MASNPGRRQGVQQGSSEEASPSMFADEKSLLSRRQILIFLGHIF